MTAAHAATEAVKNAACPESAPTSAQAIALARQCKGQVEQLDLRTETGQVFANPDGTSEAHEYGYPQRVRKADGSWSALDATLVRNADGTVSPRASTLDTELSGGGNGPLVVGKREGHSLELSWPGTLPQPVLAGNTATYPNVFRGADLVMNVTETGFNEVLVIHDRAAAQNPELRGLKLGTKLDGLTWNDSEGGLRATDGKGRVVMATNSARLWDSSAAKATRVYAAEDARPADAQPRSGVRGPGYGARSGEVKVSLSGGKLALAPDLSVLDDAATVYPVYLDPGPNYTKWTMINSQYPNQSYWAYDKTDCPPNPAGGYYQTECAKVGRAVGYSMIYRSMWEFDATPWWDKQVLNTRFSIDILHSAVCDSYAWTQLRWVNGYLHSGATWNNIASAWEGYDSGSSNVSSCQQARKLTEYSGGRLQEVVVAAARDHWGYTTWGLKAEDESNSNDWKKFDAKTAQLIVNLNNVPRTPDNLKVDDKACATGANRPFVPTLTPTLKSHLYDADGDAMDDWFAYAQQKYTDLPLAGDFNADNKDDAAFWRPSDGNWHQAITGGAVTSPWKQWGLTGDIPLIGDVNGDNSDDVLVWRTSTGEWYVNYTNGSAGLFKQWGLTGDVPLVGDINGDHLDDVIVYRPSNSHWYVAYTNGSALDYRYWGEAGDKPLMGDFNGDGKDDMAIWRPSNGQWWVAHTDGTAGLFNTLGSNGDTPFVGDFNGDGKDDIAVWRAGTNGWDVAYTGGSTAALNTGWGTGGDSPVIGDFNGDNKDDIAIFHGGTWTVAYTGGSTATLRTGFGSTSQGWVDAGGGMQSTVPNDAYGQITTIPLQQNGVYTFRSQANDYPSRGPIYGNYGTSPVTDPIGNCEWQVDTVAPPQPGVSGDVYLAGQSTGGPGRSGKFTLTGVSDVKYYKWGWSDPPNNLATPGTLGGSATIEWTPQTPGAKTLYVKAYDRADNTQTTTKTYQFIVGQPTPAQARWKLNTAGSPQADDTGSGWDATVTGALTVQSGRIVSESAAGFNGSAYASTSGPVLADTRNSFSVSGWVKLTDKTQSRTVISQLGSNNQAFRLEYASTDDTWRLTTSTADQTTPSGYPAAVALSKPVAGVWTHLTGTYDAAAHELRIYVNGQLEGVQAGVSTWDANGVTRIGSAWIGQLANVQVWDRAITSDEVRDLADPASTNWGSNVGKWNFDYGYDPSIDESAYAHDLNYMNGATIAANGILQLDGTDDHMATDGQVLHTDQSFSVSTKVWIASGTTMNNNRTALGQDGVHISGFFLGYRYDGTGVKWSFSMPDTDTANPTWAHAQSSTYLTAADQGVWVKLTATYDASSKTLKLYVNDTLAGTGTRLAGVSNWDSPGVFTVGRAWWQDVPADPWKGNIDEVFAYQGVLAPNVALNRAATADSSCNANESAAKAVNGVWAATTDKWCSTGATRWLQVDLGRSQPIKLIRLRHADQGSETATWNTRDFTLQVSDDASSWTTVATVAGNTAGLTDHAFVPVTKRYVRLNVTTPSQNGDPAARIYELEVY